LIDCVVVLSPIRPKIGNFGDVPQTNLLAWYGKTISLTQQKHTHSPIKRNVLQHKINTKTKARFSRLLRDTVWKRRGPILVSALHKFIAYILTYLLTYLDTYPTYLQPRYPRGAHGKGKEGAKRRHG